MVAVLDLFRLEKKVVVVTGAAGLLGQQHCKAIAEAGGTPVAWDKNLAGLRSLETQMRQEGLVVITRALDVTSEVQVKEAASELVSLTGPIWGLVNNVALNPSMGDEADSTVKLEDFALSSWDAGLKTNLTSAFLCSREIGQSMAAAGEGCIINVASDLAIIAPDQRIYQQEGSTNPPRVKPVIYSVSKTALIGLTRYLSTYWAPLPIRANALLPGPVINNQGERMLKEICSRIPLGRLASKNEFKGPLIFLLSDASSFMTGTTLVVDGGRTAW